MLVTRLSEGISLRETFFDENLPLYSYGEDYELSLRLKKFGRVGRLSNAVGVRHHPRTIFSQANP
jgi:hypothetical protein